MLDKPRLEDAKIMACLKVSYDLTVTGMEFLPLGYDSYAGVYRVQANGQLYFLKVKSDTVDELSVLLPRYLKEQGIEQVVAPLPTITQEPWGTVDHFTLILYPFIEGKSGWEVGLSDTQWTAFGTVLKKLHATRLTPELVKRMPKETFVPHPKWMAVIRQLHAAVGDQVYDHPFEKQLAAFWKSHHHEINTIIDHTEQLGRMLQDKSPGCVLCHADIHTANLLIDAQGKLFIVDWDQPVLAPRERDLMFVTVGGFVTEERAEALFFQGYGKTDIDPLVMAYYRYERVMEDLSAFAEHVFFMDVSDEKKQDSINWFMVQFAPGGLVEAAHKLDHVLSM
ncbi:MAG: aminoglycoside phosphotransferase family protein [Anaerolineae bacterium]|nr:aminoglycoside phosphotransferase family protein [Anaerolineae bacterium]